MLVALAPLVAGEHGLGVQSTRLWRHFLSEKSVIFESKMSSCMNLLKCLMVILGGPLAKIGVARSHTGQQDFVSAQV